MHKTLVIDIVNEKVLDLINDLENLDLIKVRKNVEPSTSKKKLLKYRGKMSRQPLHVIEEQLRELRNGWE